MKMVIELEDDLYKRILDMKQPLFMNDLDSVYKAIVNGTTLPEHHGRLIDLNDLYDFDRRKVEYAPTIIEAEGE